MRTYPSRRSVVKMLRLDTILSHIKKKPMTIHQVGELVDVKYATAKIYLRELHKNGDVHICKYERTRASYRPVFKFGNSPDASKPDRIPHSFYDKKRPKRPYKPRKKNYEQYDNKPRRDIAASWF